MGLPIPAWMLIFFLIAAVVPFFLIHHRGRRA